jgi:hypothetical protein
MKVYEAVKLLNRLESAHRILTKDIDFTEPTSLEGHAVDPILRAIFKVTEELENKEVEFFPQS